MTSGARHVLTILAVEDLEACTDFYRRAFGWEQATDDDAAYFADPGGNVLVLARPSQERG